MLAPTGKVPFEGETALSIAMKQKGEAPKNPKVLNPHLPDDLSGIILKCLEKDRSRRYQAVNLVPISKDAIEGPIYVLDLAEIFCILGEYEKAIDRLDYLLSIPAGMTVSIPLLQLDPRWDALRDQPKFKRMIEKYAKGK